MKMYCQDSPYSRPIPRNLGQKSGGFEKIGVISLDRDVEKGVQLLAGSLFFKVLNQMTVTTHKTLENVIKSYSQQKYYLNHRR
jgi:hypothetical protein